MRCSFIVALVFFGACESDGSDPTPECPAAPTLHIEPLLDAVDPYCAVDECTADEGSEYCRFWLPFDALTRAQLSVEPQACLDALVDQLECRERTACGAGCEAERAAAEAPCELSMTPSVPEPFEGARALCEARVFCGVTPGDPGLEFDVAECQAEQGARLWVQDWFADLGCACELQDLLSCLARADLSCDPGRAEETAACPAESSTLSLCETGSRCVRLAGSGSADRCEEEVSCDATVYEASCTDGACSCTVGGAPGPAIGATECEGALRECGAPL